MTSRWSSTLEGRKYKCHTCFCLMGLHTRCLNTRCKQYGGKLTPETPS